MRNSLWIKIFGVGTRHRIGGTDYPTLFLLICYSSRREKKTRGKERNPQGKANVSADFCKLTTRWFLGITLSTETKGDQLTKIQWGSTDSVPQSHIVVFLSRLQHNDLAVKTDELREMNKTISFNNRVYHMKTEILLTDRLKSWGILGPVFDPVLLKERYQTIPFFFSFFLLLFLEIFCGHTNRGTRRWRPQSTRSSIVMWIWRICKMHIIRCVRTWLIDPSKWRYGLFFFPFLDSVFL